MATTYSISITDKIADLEPPLSTLLLASYSSSSQSSIRVITHSLNGNYSGAVLSTSPPVVKRYLRVVVDIPRFLLLSGSDDGAGGSGVIGDFGGDEQEGKRELLERVMRICEKYLGSYKGETEIEILVRGFEERDVLRRGPGIVERKVEGRGRGGGGIGVGKAEMDGVGVGSSRRFELGN